MAQCIPENILSIDTATPGEKRVFKILKTILPDDCVVYYNLEMNGLDSDILVIVPDTGIIVLEIKDWIVDNIVEADNNYFTFKSGDREEKILNPYNQSKTYMYELINLLKKDQDMINTEDKYKGKLKYPVSSGVVFTNIKKRQFDSSIMSRNIDEKAIIFQNDLMKLEKERDEDLLLGLLKDMFTVKFDFDTIDVDKIRSILFPETVLLKNKNILKTMNIEQEQVAKSLGKGHRVIRGVAGSGKSIILICRAKYLSMQGVKNILVLCYNKSFASYLRDKLKDYPNINVIHFHGWINKLDREILGGNGGIYKEEDTRETCKILKEKFRENDRLKYDAILVDEGQDFEKIWLQLVVAALKNNEDGDLLLVSDGAQNLYGRSYTFLDANIQARGRSKIFRKNYRNTKEILEFANSYINMIYKNNEYNELENDFIIEPDEIMREGEEVEVIEYSYESEKNDFLREIVENELYKYNEEDICLLCFGKKETENYTKLLNNFGYIVNNLKDEHSIKDNHINISTVHSSKGFEFKSVILLDINDYSYKKYGTNINKLIYVGMTRAQEKLYVISKRDTEFNNLLLKSNI